MKRIFFTIGLFFITQAVYCQAYLNGVEIGTATTRTINPNPNNSPLYISGPTYSLNRKIAISRIYNRALTATEVLQNYNAQKGRFGL